jgi:tetratricopeptide (TPR) repeat protein
MKGRLKWIAIAAVLVLVAGGYWRWRSMAFYEKLKFDCSDRNNVSANEMISKCTELVDYAPKYASGYSERASAYARKGDHGQAIADLDAAVKLDPGNPSFPHTRAGIYRDLGQHDRAIVDYTTALNLFLEAKHPGLQGAERLNVIRITETYQKRAESYRETRQYDLAIADIDETIRRGKGWNVETRARLYLEKGDFDTAIAEYDQLIKERPRESLFYYLRGAAYGSKRDYDRAIADFDAAIKFAARYASAFEKRGRAFEEKGEGSRAVADYRTALSIDPSLTFARAALKRLGIE